MNILNQKKSQNLIDLDFFGDSNNQSSNTSNANNNNTNQQNNNQHLSF